MISFYETFFLEDIDNDFTVAASVVFSLMKKFALDSSFDTMYLSRAEDGAFLGYHNKKDANGSYEMSFLPGWDCPWNYTKACNGSDPCDAAYPGFQPACRHRVDAMEVWESDGADSSWSDIYEFHSNGDLGITATRVYADWRGRRTMTASVDYVLSAVDAAVAGATTTGDVAYVMEYRTGLLVAVSEGRRVDADGKRVTPYDRALISADDLYRLDAEAAAPPIKPTPRGQNRHDLETDMRARETDVIANLVRRFSSDDGDGDGDGPAAAATDGARPRPATAVADGPAAARRRPADDDDAGACAAAGCVAPP
ncbi:hypothetical protein SO694_00031051 [Aureococcus anophagefferens]|uniref:Uncharacterized protein n=1 Tax=Aureococcus anophagefferens TaxID=44056 RepID=A0ABR1FJH2_AURAN